jgi:hypothetical protein
LGLNFWRFRHKLAHFQGVGTDRLKIPSRPQKPPLELVKSIRTSRRAIGHCRLGRLAIRTDRHGRPALYWIGSNPISAIFSPGLLNLMPRGPIPVARNIFWLCHLDPGRYCIEPIDDDAEQGAGGEELYRFGEPYRRRIVLHRPGRHHHIGNVSRTAAGIPSKLQLSMTGR